MALPILKKQQANTPNTRFQIGSIQKSFTTTLILKAIEEGKLTLDTKLATFYPQIQGAEDITISDMLNMTSGLKLSAMPNNIVTDEEIIQFVKQNTIQVNKGKYNYSPVNFVLLAGMLEKMYQRTYQELFNNLYHKTAGLKILASMKPYWNSPIIQQVINGQKIIHITKCSQFLQLVLPMNLGLVMWI